MTESVYREAIRITNKNVYFTNVLLLPALMFSILGAYDIKYNWKDILKTKKLDTYLNMWVGFSILIVLVILFSTIYHKYMFSEIRPLLKKIGKIDHKFTAPLFSLIMIFLNIVYIRFLNKKCANLPDNYVLYLVALIFCFFGLVIFLIKRYVIYPRYQKKGFLKKMKYFMSHTFFHYIAYTGVTLLMSLFYLDNKEIYRTFFLNESCKIKGISKSN